MNTKVYLQGKYVIVRSIELSDAETTLLMRVNREKTKYMGTQIENDLQHEINWIKQIIDRNDDYTFTVTDTKGTQIGNTSIYDIVDKTAQSGRLVMYGNAFQSIEALLLVQNYAFNQLGLEKLWSCVDPNNKSALKISKLFGEVFEDPVFDETIGRPMCIGWLTKEQYVAAKPMVEKLLYRM